MMICRLWLGMFFNLSETVIWHGWVIPEFSVQLRFRRNQIVEGVSEWQVWGGAMSEGFEGWLPNLKTSNHGHKGGTDSLVDEELNNIREVLQTAVNDERTDTETQTEAATNLLLFFHVTTVLDDDTEYDAIRNSCPEIGTTLPNWFFWIVQF